VIINRIKEYRGGWLKIVSPTIKEISKAESIINRSLSYTDAERIAIAKNRNFIFLTDDKYAAKIALKENVRVWDLMLFLAICIKKDLISSKEELNVLLSELAKKDNYRFASEDEIFLYKLFEKKNSKEKIIS
jgi:predicted nucleic acid-binding protein